MLVSEVSRSFLSPQTQRGKAAVPEKAQTSGKAKIYTRYDSTSPPPKFCPKRQVLPAGNHFLQAELSPSGGVTLSRAKTLLSSKEKPKRCRNVDFRSSHLAVSSNKKCSWHPLLLGFSYLQQGSSSQPFMLKVWVLVLLSPSSLWHLWVKAECDRSLLAAGAT